MDVRKSEVSAATKNKIPKLDLTLEVNGTIHQLQADATTRLVDLLREQLGLTGTKISCEIGRCGSCAVHMDGKLVNSCLVMAYQANHMSIRTIEGITCDNELNSIQNAFLQEGGFQCGYCTPGMVMAVQALLETNDTPTDEEIREALSGNLCRCTGYSGIIRAVHQAISSLQKHESSNNCS